MTIETVWHHFHMAIVVCVAHKQIEMLEPVVLKNLLLYLFNCTDAATPELIYIDPSYTSKYYQIAEI